MFWSIILAHGGWREEVSTCQGTCGAAVKTTQKFCDKPEPSHRLVYGIQQQTGENCICDSTDSTETFCNGLTATNVNPCDDELCE